MAIAFDAANSGFSAGAQNTLTIAATVTGDDTIGVVLASHDGSQTMLVSGITWNGVAMTNVNNNGNATSNSNTSLWYVINPTTGDVVITVSSTRQLYGIVLSYTGANQSGQPDASNTADDSASPYTISTTTVADNSLVVCGIRGGNVLSASTNVTARSEPFNSIKIGDGTQVTAGAFSQSWTDTIDGETAILTVSIAPVSAQATVQTNPTLLMLNVG